MDEKQLKDICQSAISPDELIAIRREFHKYPELSGKEYGTMERIASLLKSWGISHEKGIAGTGLVARIRGNRPGFHVALRADMDALACTEQNPELSFASCQKGAMHACGHDIHTTILLGVAKVFQSLCGDFPGSVTLLFQPAEEGDGGAKPMIAQGCLENPHIDYVLGLHVEPALPTGQIGVVYGKMYAASEMIKIRIYGKSAHGARPQEGIDAILIAANIINTLQTVVSRNMDPTDAAVCTIGKIHGGNVRNQIAEFVECEGIVRTLSLENRLVIRNQIRRICETTAQAMGGRAEVLAEEGYDPLITDRKVTDVVCAAARKVLGPDSVYLEPAPRLEVEDFAYFAAERPACFYHLGCSLPGTEKTAPRLHSSHFNPDENCIMLGVLLQVASAWELLEPEA